MNLIKNKNSNNINNFFDKIYIINLTENIDRKNNIIQLFKSLNITNYKFYNAINGYNISKNDIKNYLTTYSLNTLNGNYRNHSDIRKLGEIGCYLSHYNIWVDSVKNNYKNILIFEDDIINNMDIYEIEEYLQNIPKDYDLAYLGYGTIILNKLELDETFYNNYWKRSLFNVFGAYSYALSNKGCNKLIKKALPISEQIDQYLNYYSYYDNNFNKYIPKNKLFIPNTTTSIMHVNPCYKCFINDLINNLIIRNVYVIIIIIIILIFIIRLYYYIFK